MSTVRAPDGSLWLGGIRLEELAARPEIGTPTYVYDLGGIAHGARALHAAFEEASHLIAYALKANSAGSVVRALVAEGCGADVVSGGELAVALGCGVSPGSILFSGVAKTDAEIDMALACGPEGIGALQAESFEELLRIEARAQAAGRRARVSLRINPALTFDTLSTHAHIATGHDQAKFGLSLLDLPEAVALLTRSPSLHWVGVGLHIGSQLMQVKPYLDAAKILFSLAREARSVHKAPLCFVDTGGGFGIDYQGGEAVQPAEFVRAVRVLQREEGVGDLQLRVEPGRSLVAQHGVLLARVIQAKVAGRGEGPLGVRRWIFLDAGMNDLLRPALYQAHHRIVPLDQESPVSAPLWRVAGPVCESTDDFGAYPFVAPPQWVAILDAGAYGYTMASLYNGRPLPAEAFVREGILESFRPRLPASQWAQERLTGGGALS